MRPSQRQGLPLRPTRATVCQWRPSISQGMRASWPTSVISRSPVSLGLGRGKVEYLARLVRTGGKDGDERLAGVRAEERRSAETGEGETGRFSACVLRFTVSSLRPAPLLLLPSSAYATTSSGVPGDDDISALVAGLRPHVDHPVGRLDHVEIVLDDHHRVAQLDEPVEHVQQLGQVVKVQAGGRLVEHVERVARVGAGEFGRQLHALGLAAGERGGGLAEREVIEAHVAQRLQDAANLGYALEKLHGLAAGHFQHLGDRLAVVADGQRLFVVAAGRGRCRTPPKRPAGSASRCGAGRCLRTSRNGRRAR